MKESPTFQNTLPYVSMRPGGNILPQTSIQVNGTFRPVLNQAYVKATEPYGTNVPTKRLERSSGWSQMANMSHEFTLDKVQAALRSAERGDLTLLWAYLRDFFISNPTVGACLSKRKLSTLSENHSILPASPNPDDVINAKIIEQLLSRYGRLVPALSHMLNATILPVSALEKTFDVIDENYGTNEYNLRYCIRELSPIDYQLINFRLPYLPQGPINIGNQQVVPAPPLMQNMTGRPEDTIFNPDAWEPALRFWSVMDNGMINYSYAYIQEPDPKRHIIYRSNLLNGIAPENFGGIARPLLFLAIMSQLGLNNYLNALNRWGVPFIVGKVDMTNVDAVNQITEAFDKANILHALAINKDAEIQLVEANSANMAEGHALFLEYIDKKIELLIQGETLSSEAKSTGLGSGVADLHSDVRQDYIHYDRLCLDNELRTGLFTQLLEINGRKNIGEAPHISFGGGNSITENKDLATIISTLHNVGFDVDETSVDDLSLKFGFQLKKIQAPAPTVSNNNSGFNDTVKQSTIPEAPKPATAEDVMAHKAIDTQLGVESKNSVDLHKNDHS